MLCRCMVAIVFGSAPWSWGAKNAVRDPQREISRSSQDALVKAGKPKQLQVDPFPDFAEVSRQESAH